MERKKIVVIENSVHVTGALKSITRTSYDLREYFDFVFIMPSHSVGVSYLKSKGFTAVYELPMRELSRRPFNMVLYVPFLLINAFRLRGIVQKEEAHLIHVNDLYNLLPVVLKFMGVRIPIICHVRFLPDSFPEKLFSFWVQTYLTHAKFLICVSDFLKNKLPINQKIKRIHNELPIEERLPPSVGNTNTILYLSNVIRGKGQEYAIEAFSNLVVSFPCWKLRFVGGDMGLLKNKEFKTELIALCQQKGIARQVEWTDYVDDVETEYKNATIALNFSESESFSLTCVEAQFYGCPLVATQSGGPSEIIIDGQSGFLVPKRDIKAMVLAMKKLMADDLLRTTFARNGREVVRERFSIVNTSYQLKQYYLEALS